MSVGSGWSSELEFGNRKDTTSPMSQLERMPSAPPAAYKNGDANLTDLVGALSLDRELRLSDIHRQQVCCARNMCIWFLFLFI